MKYIKEFKDGKYYEVGDKFIFEDRLVEVVEEDTRCKGCIFSKTACPNSECYRFLRKDKKSIEFHHI